MIVEPIRTSRASTTTGVWPVYCGSAYNTSSPPASTKPPTAATHRPRSWRGAAATLLADAGGTSPGTPLDGLRRRGDGNA